MVVSDFLIATVSYQRVSTDKLVKSLDEDDFKNFRNEFPDDWQYLNKKLAHPYQYFHSIDDFKKTC